MIFKIFHSVFFAILLFSISFSAMATLTKSQFNQIKKKFQTHIQEALSQGSNFDKKYTIANWSCGSPCNMSVILKTKTGNALEVITSCHPLEFNKDSNLIKDSASAFQVCPQEDVCYRWKNEKLKKLESCPDSLQK